jgi:acetyl-CoA carboxylase alpha subunit
VGNTVLMLENSVYSVISPESCAAIIYRDSGKAEQAAAALRMTAQDLTSLGLIDGVVPEPPGGAQEDPAAAAEYLRLALNDSLDKLANLSGEQLVAHRYAKFRKMGNFFA